MMLKSACRSSACDPPSTRHEPAGANPAAHGCVLCASRYGYSQKMVSSMIAKKHHRSLGSLRANLHTIAAPTCQQQDISRRSLECMHAELLHCASLSCATASTVHACRQGESFGPGALCALLPPAPSAFPAVIGRLLEHAEFHDLAENLREYYALQGIARGLTEMLEAGNRGRDPMLNIDNAAAAWRDVAAMAQHALVAFDCVLPGSPRASRAKQLYQVLERVRSGGQVDHADCELRQLNATGERRGLTRSHVNTYIRVERGMSLHEVLVNDFSERGLGLEGLSDVTPGDVLRVLWKPVTAIVARVSWANARRFGLEIVEETALAHEFFRGLIEAEPLPTQH